MENIIETQQLNFWYKADRKVLDEVCLAIPTGSIYGFLGPNGAGKSTTMRLLTGILPEQGDAIRIFGQPLREQLPYIFHQMGTLVEQPALYPHLSGEDNLRYVCQLRNIPTTNIDKALQQVDLLADRKRKVSHYSLGMKQRLAIGIALLNQPSLLLLDEPVNGLDPTGIQEIRQLLVDLNKNEGVSIFVSSHLLAEVEKMCTHVGIIHQGQMKFQGSIKELGMRSESVRLTVTLDDAAHWLEKIKSSFPEAKILNAQQLDVQLAHRDQIPVFIQALVQVGAQVHEVRQAGGLEDWFLSLTSSQA
jgi:ABC-type multidrug transport system ATPase subunit